MKGGGDLGGLMFAMLWPIYVVFGTLFMVGVGLVLWIAWRLLDLMVFSGGAA